MENLIKQLNEKHVAFNCSRTILKPPAYKLPLKRVALRSARIPAPATMETAIDYYKHGLVSLSKDMRMEVLVAGLSDFKPVPFLQSQYVCPASVSFLQKNGDEIRKRTWDYIEAHDSVAVLIYKKDTDSLLLVRQFRPTVYARVLKKAKKSNLPDPPISQGFTYELCAGLVDKDKPVAQIAQEEILEECGFDVPLSEIKLISTYLSSIGTAGTTQSLFFAEVTEEMKVAEGGGLEHTGEAIELLSLPFDKIDDFVFDSSLPKSTGLMFAFQWLQKQRRVT